MSTQKVPLTSDPNQNFDITLDVDDANLTLNLTFTYNSIAEYWAMDVKDSDDNLLISSLPLITGTNYSANLLEQYSYLKIGSAFLIKSSDTDLNYPDGDTLGTDFYLIWSDTP